MKLMRRRRALAVTCILFVSLAHPAGAAQRRDMKVYSPVPEDQRERLDERLRLYIGFERARRFDEVYDLLSPAYLASLRSRGVADKSAYVKSLRDLGDAYLHIEDFTPYTTKRAEHAAGDVYLIEGWVVSRWGKTVHRDKGSLEAHLVEGQWYFSELGLEIVD